MLDTFTFVILVLFELLLLIYQMIFLSSKSFNFLVELLKLEILLLFLYLYLTLLRVTGLLQRCQICHQSVVFLFMKFELFLLCLGRTLFLLKFNSVFMHGISI